MSGEVSVTTFVPEDLEQLRRHLQESWLATYEPVFGSAIAQDMVALLSDETLAGVVPQNDETVLIARIQDTILGCAVIAERHGTAYLWGVYVAPAWQRQGIGTLLVRRAVSVLEQARSVQAMVLIATDEAVRFYRSLGFSIDDEIGIDLTQSFCAQAHVMTASVPALKTAFGQR